MTQIFIRFKILLKALFKMGVIGSCKTIVFNFRYFPFRQAIYLPIILSSKVKVVNMGRDRIVFDGLGGVGLVF